MFDFRTQSNERVRLSLVIEESGTHKRKPRVEQNKALDSVLTLDGKYVD